GSDAQNAVVIANAGMALKCANESLSISEAVEKARESLLSGKALTAFKKLMNKSSGQIKV
ncbi:MAG: anthranilate phosphoribosyltransferase, partial [Cyclobacteriaceae bacterium]